jgi:hypothetical protein
MGPEDELAATDPLVLDALVTPEELVTSEELAVTPAPPLPSW